jgi:hypothetical protein
MQTTKDICDSILYIENERWQCSFGHGEPVKLGLVLEAIDLGGSGEDSFPFVIDACLIPQPEHLDKELLLEAKSEGALTREEQIRYIYECYGGVPVNIDAVQPAKASCGFSSFVAESSIVSVKAQSGEEIEVRHFQDMEEAMLFARDFYAAYAHLLIGFIDVVLDNSLRAGGTGWDKIRQMSGYSR